MAYFQEERRETSKSKIRIKMALMKILPDVVMMMS